MLSDEIFDEEMNTIVQRYWIDTESALSNKKFEGNLLI